LVDQPFVVGDTIRVDTIEGKVETIGLRSTRIRTADRTLVMLPNGKLADMRIESLGRRDRIRFLAKLPLRRDTSASQLEAITDAIRSELINDARVHKEDMTVQLIAIGEWSFDIEVSALTETCDAKEFAKIREALLLRCISLVNACGAQLAVPTRHHLSESSSL